MAKTFYNKRHWVNPESSPSTGSIVCYHGISDSSDGEGENIFIEIADCRSKVRLHKTHADSKDDFIKKIEALQDALDDFYNYLVKSDD